LLFSVSASTGENLVILDCSLCSAPGVEQILKMNFQGIFF